LIVDDDDELEALPRSETTEFAHNSERQFARLLDFYQIEWEYEPRSFDIGWDRNGEPNQRFRPDFYLPQYDTYIEITTLNQKLVTKKNRKVRLLRELYPDIKCKIFYQRDYLDLLIKYGLEKPSQDAPGADNGVESGDLGSEEDEGGPQAQVI
jgi:bifunctional protein TilS/HprT